MRSEVIGEKLFLFQWNNTVIGFHVDGISL